jgi:hypothetical protein
MPQSLLKRLLPGWPVVPSALWLTSSAVILLIVNLCIVAEVWPHTPAAVPTSQALLVLLLLAGGGQIVVMLWKWARMYNGPKWMRLLLQLIVVLGINSIFLFGFALCILLTFVFSF